MQRIDAQAAVVGERRQARKVGRRARLQVGVVGEGDADFLRLGQAQASSAPMQSRPSGASSAAISRSLPALCVAMTILGPIALTGRSP